LFAVATSDILHEEYEVDLVDLLVLDLEHSVNFGDEGVGVGEEVTVKVLKVFEQKGEFLFIDSFEDVFVVRGEKEEFPALAAIALNDLIQLVAVFNQLEASPKLFYIILLEQSAEDLGRIDCELPLEQ
jgi:hypothetical protein